jgi:hypothetical protein
MGASSTNLQVKSDKQEEVITHLKSIIKSRAYVSTPNNGWIAIYDETSDRCLDEAYQIAEKLSLSLLTTVFVFSVYDSDIYFYAFYENGVLLDEYNSDPEYFDGFGRFETSLEESLRLKGSPPLIIKYCRDGTTLEYIKNILYEEYILADELPAKFAELLGINAEYVAYMGFNYYEEALDYHLGFDYHEYYLQTGKFSMEELIETTAFFENFTLIECTGYKEKKEIYDALVNYLRQTYVKQDHSPDREKDLQRSLKDMDDISNHLINAFKYYGNYKEVKHTLITSIIFWEEELVNLFINSNNIDDHDSSGRTALIWAAILYRLDFAKQLIEAGATTTIKDNLNYTALMYAQLFEHTKVVNLLE